VRILLLMALVAFTSCATSYSCKTDNLGKCQSVSEVFEHVKNGEKRSESVEVRGKEVMDTPLLGMPVLKEPVVLRVLLNHWEDEDQDLVMGGYIFIKVRDAAWSI
jgi:hypothetical protein